MLIPLLALSSPSINIDQVSANCQLSETASLLERHGSKSLPRVNTPVIFTSTGSFYSGGVTPFNWVCSLMHAWREFSFFLILNSFLSVLIAALGSTEQINKDCAFFTSKLSATSRLHIQSVLLELNGKRQSCIGKSFPFLSKLHKYVCTIEVGVIRKSLRRHCKKGEGWSKARIFTRFEVEILSNNRKLHK